MTDPAVPRLVCAITGRPHSRRDLIPLSEVRPTLADRIRRDHPALAEDALISKHEVAAERIRYVEEMLRTEHGELTELERQVAASIAAQDTIAANVENQWQERRSIGEILSDHLASFGGSWAFLIAFAIVLVVWMLFNAALGTRAFDPYPFILLNLALSCLAAVQAPIIMMSQRRQETKDRLRALNDYQVNLKAELEVRHLHEKLDHLMSRQWQRLAEIQALQLEIMQEGRRPRG